MRIKKLFSIFSALLVLILGSAHGASINIMLPGTTEPLQITMDTVKRTTRALAMRLNSQSDVVYANMMPVETSWNGGGMFARIDNQTYQVGVPPKFFITTTPNTTSFSFKISARGSFYIDWGDGNVETFIKNNTTNTTYSHTYTSAGEHKISIGGHVTSYATGATISAINFSSNTNIAKIEGSLGAIFSTIGDGSASSQQPRFYNTFYMCTNLAGSIPKDLFTGIKGKPVTYMFNNTFRGCSGLNGSIPEELFAGIEGTPASSMFSGTFWGCRGLEGTIPENLFAKIEGQPASSMFYGTFSGCSGLGGTIPENLFAKIEGKPASSMFYATFNECSKLSGPIPEKLFAKIEGAPASGMFYYTFLKCTNIDGPIPGNIFAKITGKPAADMFHGTFAQTSVNSAIPANLFAGIDGQPAKGMYSGLFSGCSHLSGAIPNKLFGKIYGAPAANMFYGTFTNCSSLTSIPEDLFGDISGTAATDMFREAFSNCTSLTGPSARINGEYLYNIWPDENNGCYHYASGLSDFGNIPEGWKTYN